MRAADLQVGARVVSKTAGLSERLRRYETGTKRQTTGLALVRSFRGDYKMIAEQEEQ